MGLGLVARDKARKKGLSHFPSSIRSVHSPPDLSVCASPDELPQTVIVKDNSGVKEESGETLITKPDPDILPPPPPPNLIIKTEVKKKDEEELSPIDPNQAGTNEPCTKMTMRLRRNLSNTQFVSAQSHASRLEHLHTFRTHHRR